MQAATSISLDSLEAASEPLCHASKPNLLAMSAEALERFIITHGGKAFHGRQMFSWLFAKRAQSIADMTDISKHLRMLLADICVIERPRIDACYIDASSNRKYRFVAADNTAFEAVYMPDIGPTGRTNTLCISSQSGCAVGCKFCFTASLKRNRNLDVAEIVGQVLAVRDDVVALGESAQVTNIVFMGMGEPLLNYDNVIQACKILLHPAGCGFSSRRITISTAGIVPRIYELGRDVPVQLAISLNATTDAVRTLIMPINKKWPLAELLTALRAYPLAPRRRITIEYVLLQDINDTVEDAQRLADLLQGIPVKINLLPLNPHARTVLSAPTEQRVRMFQHTLRQLGYNALVRTARGQKIAAACGQLGESAQNQNT